MTDNWSVAGRTFSSRLIVGTGKYKDFEQNAAAVEASGAEIVTVAVRRVNVSDPSAPMLTDYIDPKKDRRKDMPWIGQFSIASWKDVNTAEWALRKDGGSFGYRTGATISARAVVGAVGRATAWASARQDDLFSAPAGSTLGVQP